MARLLYILALVLIALALYVVVQLSIETGQLIALIVLTVLMAAGLIRVWFNYKYPLE